MSNYDINSNPCLVKQMIENEKTAVSKAKGILLFVDELQGLGYVFEVPSQVPGFLPKHKKTILPIAVKYYQQAKTTNEKNYFMRLFHYRGFEEVVPMLLQDFYSNDPLVDRWAIGDCIYQIGSTDYIDDYLKIVADKKYGISRQMIVLLLGKLKVEKAIPVLIALIDDADVTGHSINALGQFGKEDLRSCFERFLDHKNSYYRREAQKALKRINSRNVRDG